jgi:hypothetical protein
MGLSRPFSLAPFARLAKICRSADAKAPGAGYGGLEAGRAGSSSGVLLSSAPPIVRAAHAYRIRRGLRFADATWGCFPTMAFAAVQPPKPSRPGRLTFHIIPRDRALPFGTRWAGWTAAMRGFTNVGVTAF